MTTTEAPTTDNAVEPTRPLETGWLADTHVEDNLLRAFVHNQGRLDAIVAGAKAGRVGRTDDVFLADARSAVPYFNQAILTRPLTGPDDAVLGEVEGFFDGSRPHTLLSVWPTPDLSARGWALAGHPAVVVRGPGAVPPHARDGVEVRVVTDAAGLAEAKRVFVEGFPIPEAAGEDEFPPSLLGTDLSFRHGVLDGEVAAVGMGHVSDGLVNLCGGTTLPSARRRGVWEALVWARVSDAPGLPAIAYTSDYSRPGFVRMGFLPITRFTLWHRGS